MTETTIYARPNLNGNTPDHFVRAARDMLEIADDLRTHMQKDVYECLHGRNYQFQEDSLQKRVIDVDKLTELLKTIDAFTDYALVLHRAAKADAENLPKNPEGWEMAG